MTNYSHTQVADAKTMEIIIKQNFLPRIIKHLKDIASLGVASPVYKKETPKFEKMYSNLLDVSNSLRSFVDRVGSADDLETKVVQATELHEFIDLVSEQVSEIETELPSSKDSPQLF